MNIRKTLSLITILSLSALCHASNLADKTNANPISFDGLSIIPQPYDGGLKNPLMGFTTINMEEHPWATLTHTYIKWNEIEDKESDGIDKIKKFCDTKWKNAEKKNLKVIPRVYLHYDKDQKYWPSDMTSDDYTSEQFQERVVRLIERLGECWDNDPRVAFVELGIFGKWGEHHSPDVTTTLQTIVATAFAESFKNKKVTVRHNWREFTTQPFGEYWDSWAHYDQMWTHGNEIKKVNDKFGRYKNTFIGGEVAYNWGGWEIQPGQTPTKNVSLDTHRNFTINSIRWLHCSQLRWISGYDINDEQAAAGAEEIQKAFGYRFVLNDVKFAMDSMLRVAIKVTNTGSAPFYYQWPVEISLLDAKTHQPVWKELIPNADIRKWLPGENWTSPDFEPNGSWQKYLPDESWNSNGIAKWEVEPVANEIGGAFNLNLHNGTYILAIAIIDPASNKPSVKFATSNYLNGARHPIGLVNIGNKECRTLPAKFKFNDPKTDNTLHY